MQVQHLKSGCYEKINGATVVTSEVFLRGAPCVLN